MSELLIPEAVRRPGAAVDEGLAISARLHRGACELAGRLGALLGGDHPAAEFLAALGRAAQPALSGDETWPPDGGIAGHPAGRHPVDRLAAGLRLPAAEVDLLLLAGLAEEHEGLAEVLRGLHPQGKPAATAGLAAALAEAGQLTGDPSGGEQVDVRLARLWVRQLLASGRLVAAGAVTLDAGPFFERTMCLADGLWPVLHGDADWPAGARPVDPDLVSATPAGLSVEDSAVRTVLRAAATGFPITAVLSTADPAGAAIRLAGLARGTGANPLVLLLPRADRSSAQAVALAALARGVLPLLVSTELPDGAAALDDVPVPVVLSVPDGTVLGGTRRPLVPVVVPAATNAQRQQLWSRLLPEMPDAAADVPTGVGPYEAGSAARDATTAALLRGEPVSAADLRAALGNRAPEYSPSGVLRLRPTARWDDLVLPADRRAQLREAVARIRRHELVLERWGFLRGRPGRRGVRLLFCGPPGTGKTLAAEVLAAEIGRDLLVVDLSRMVSKWIGETEKNLSAAFDAAERGDVVLFFDEADALFGRRTEVGDARDRYANLETAYLLSRLSQFDGVAALATNLRQNIDPAFARRLEFVVPFDPPDAVERRALWARHLPARVPFADDVDLDQLAALYPVTGALIRNAATAAAYLAAEDGTGIGANHLVSAMRREYVKSGQAFPGQPPMIRRSPEESPCPPLRP